MTHVAVIGLSNPGGVIAARQAGAGMLALFRGHSPAG